MYQTFWFIVGCLALVCGIIGAVLPLLPTTPFLLVATFAFARSSPRLHAWLIEHPRFGPPINDWHTQGAISRNAKIMAVVAMVVTFAISLALGAAPVILTVQGIVLSCAAAFIVSRPVPVAGDASDADT